MATAPTSDLLLDHRGNTRPTFEMPLDYEQARLGLAFHEAGHAVLAMTYGVHVVSSEVVAWFPEPDRYTVSGLTTFDVDCVDAWHYAAQCAAGEIAQVQYLMAYGLWTPERALACAADHDRERAVDVLAQFGYLLGRDHVPAGGKSWGMVRGMARFKVGRLWREIRTVAHAMDENTKLTGDQIAAMTGLTNPPKPGGAA
ncbi:MULTISPECIES: hypothetical protein [Streptomyces]|uniref:Peptidase M41 domain-containing protein n=1 Tax=Streptomyces viridochromogenes TaxID=1938 RepID=A0A0L8K279_STRVR|nr:MULTISPECIES: hypothetical protein [Streptomyces]KOG20007.1 hypothetical protein ADK34_24185 [Streptomyces viridochromogenes]